MGLLLSIVILLMLGMVIFQAWQLWFIKREVARLEQRIAESLDDQDLMDFQERLQGLLSETKDAGLSLVQSLERRQEGLNKVLAKAEEAEKRLGVRTQLLELAARELAKGPVAKAPEAKLRIAPKKAAPRKPAPSAIPAAETPKAPEAPKAVEAPEAQNSAAEEARRYTSRPAAANGPSNRYQRVYELSDQGLTREQIARESGILPGEVDLILNLRPGKRR